MKDSMLSKDERKRIILQLYRKIEFLNLEDIIFSKNNIQRVAKTCKDSLAILLVGMSGVGKTTFVIGGSGYPLIYSEKTNDYRCPDPKISEKYKIGDTITS